MWDVKSSARSYKRWTPDASLTVPIWSVATALSNQIVGMQISTAGLEMGCLTCERPCSRHLWRAGIGICPAGSYRLGVRRAAART